MTDETKTDETDSSITEPEASLETDIKTEPEPEKKYEPETGASTKTGPKPKATSGAIGSVNITSDDVTGAVANNIDKFIQNIYGNSAEKEDPSDEFKPDGEKKLLTKALLDELNLKLESLPNSHRFYIGCPDFELISNIKEVLNVHEQFKEYSKRFFVNEPANIIALIEMIKKARGATKEKTKLLFFVQHQKIKTEKQYWKSFELAGEIEKLVSVLKSHNAYLLQFGMDSGKQYIDSLADKKYLFWLFDPIYAYLLLSNPGDIAAAEAKTKELREIINIQQWDSSAFNLLIQHAVTCKKVETLLDAINQTKNTLSDTRIRIDDWLQRNNLFSLMPNVYQQIENTDDMTKAILFIIGHFPGISYSDCDLLMKVLFDTKKKPARVIEDEKTAALSTEEEHNKPETEQCLYEQWHQGIDELIFKAGIRLVVKPSGKEGFYFVNENESDVTISKFKQQYPAYIRKNLLLLFKSPVPFMLRSVQTINQLSELLADHLQKTEQQEQLQVLTGLLNNEVFGNTNSFTEQQNSRFLSRLMEVMLADDILKTTVHQFLDVATWKRINPNMLLELLFKLAAESGVDVYPLYKHIIDQYETGYADYAKWQLTRLIYDSDKKRQTAFTAISKWPDSGTGSESGKFALRLIGRGLRHFAEQEAKKSGTYGLFQNLDATSQSIPSYFNCLIKWLLHTAHITVSWKISDDKEIRELACSLLFRDSYPELIEQYSETPDALAIISMYWNSSIPVNLDDVRVADLSAEQLAPYISEMSSEIKKLLLVMEAADIIARWYVLLIGDSPAATSRRKLELWNILLEELAKYCIMNEPHILLANDPKAYTTLRSSRTGSILLWHWNNYPIWNLVRNGVKSHHARALRNRFLDELQKQRVMYRHAIPPVQNR